MARSNIRSVLKAYASGLERVGGKADSKLLDELADAIAPDGVLAKAVDTNLQITDDSGRCTSVRRAMLLLTDLVGILKHAAKKDVLADLGRLADFLERHGHMSLRDMLAQLRNADGQTNGVREYSSRLKECMGDDGFEDLLNKVLSDKSIRQKELVAIADEMGNPIPPRTSKKKVAEHLISLHRSLATYRAKKKAMAGRSAA